MWRLSNIFNKRAREKKEKHDERRPASEASKVCSAARFCLRRIPISKHHKGILIGSYLFLRVLVIGR